MLRVGIRKDLRGPPVNLYWQDGVIVSGRSPENPLVGPLGWFWRNKERRCKFPLVQFEWMLVGVSDQLMWRSVSPGARKEVAEEYD